MTDGAPIGESSNRSFYNVDSKTYDRQRWASKGGAFTNRAQQLILQSLCADRQNGSILEVGSGTARFSIPLLQKHNRLTLADISPQMLAEARQKIVEAGAGDGVEAYVEGSIYELPFEDNSFDHTISLNVFNHLERPGDALQQLARVTRPCATLLFNHANLHSFYWPAARRINERRKAIAQAVYSRWERPTEMRRWIAEAGLECVQQVGHVHVPRALYKYPVLPVVYILDRASRRGPLRRFAPFQFCLCRSADERQKRGRCGIFWS